MNPIDTIEASDLKQGLPRITAGGTIRVHVRGKETAGKEEIKGKPKENQRERVQGFQGLVMRLRQPRRVGIDAPWSTGAPSCGAPRGSRTRHAPRATPRWRASTRWAVARCAAPSSPGP